MIARLLTGKLHRFQVAGADSPDQIYDLLTRCYGARDFNLRKNAESFSGTTSYLLLNNLDLSYNALSVDLSATFPGGDDLIRQQFVLSGHNRLTIGRSQFLASVNDVAIVPGDAEVRRDFYENYSHLILRIRAAALHSKLAALIGRPVGRKIEFAMGVADRTPEQMRLRRLVEFFISEVDRKDAALTDFQFAEFEQLLIVSFLTANMHNFSHLLKDETPGAAPWQVRLVEEYIEANWHRAITIEELAQETGVGARSMFIAFKRARGYTPMSFLQRIRLEHARRMLQAPSATTSVTAVGLMCGFHNAGHFARYYRQAFNELPSVTLAMAKAARRLADAAGAHNRGAPSKE